MVNENKPNKIAKKPTQEEDETMVKETRQPKIMTYPCLRFWMSLRIISDG